MTEMIEEAKKVMARENNFTFMGEAADNEAGHVANMANQVILLSLLISYYSAITITLHTTYLLYLSGCREG